MTSPARETAKATKNSTIFLHPYRNKNRVHWSGCFNKISNIVPRPSSLLSDPSSHIIMGGEKLGNEAREIELALISLYKRMPHPELMKPGP